MSKWSVAQTHEWLMKTLHEKFLEDSQASMRWPETLEATESHPCGEDIIKQSKQLAENGWVEILTQAYGCLFARLTPTGSEKWEAFVEEKKRDPSIVFPSP